MIVTMVEYDCIYFKDHEIKQRFLQLNLPYPPPKRDGVNLIDDKIVQETLGKESTDFFKKILEAE